MKSFIKNYDALRWPDVNFRTQNDEYTFTFQLSNEKSKQTERAWLSLKFSVGENISLLPLSVVHKKKFTLAAVGFEPTPSK